MGTNYYARYNICPTCKRPGISLHIGNESCGWAFSFHGIVGTEAEDSEIEPIASWEDWKILLKKPGTEIFNEYGDEMDYAEFIDSIDITEQGKNHTIYCRISHPEHAKRDCWLDEAGHSFQCGEFS